MSPRIVASSTAPAVLALLLGALAMGISPIFVRVAQAEGVGPFTSAFWRVALALPVLFAWMRVEEARAGRRGRAFTRPALLAGLAFTGDLFFWHLSIVRTTVANATFFATTAPVWVVVFSFLLFGRKAGGATLLGLALCLLGGASLMLQSLDIAPDRVIGDLYGLATAVFFGLYFLAVQAARAHAGPARVTFELTLVTAALLLVVAQVAEGALLPRRPESWTPLVAMALVSHVGGQGMLSIALGRLPAVFSSLVIFIEALFAAFFGWLILGEPVTPVQWGGGVLILCGIWLARPRADASGAAALVDLEGVNGKMPQP